MVTIQHWQRRWNDSKKGRWAAKLIRSLEPWYNRRHGKVNFYITQFVTGYVYFRHYLHKMERIESVTCLYCPNINDNVNHTFFNANDGQIREEKWK